MELVKNTPVLDMIEDYCFAKCDTIFNEMTKNSDYKVVNQQMPRRYHYDAITTIKDADGISKAKYAVEIKQRNKNFEDWEKDGSYYWLTTWKLKHLLKNTKGFNKCLYLVLHLGQWSLFDLRKIDWSKIEIRQMWQKERELDDDSPWVLRDTYFIPSYLALKTGTYDIGQRPWLEIRNPKATWSKNKK